MFPLDFVNTSQDWLILQITLARMRVAHMASHWRTTIDAAKFNSSIINYRLQSGMKTKINFFLGLGVLESDRGVDIVIYG